MEAWGSKSQTEGRRVLIWAMAEFLSDQPSCRLMINSEQNVTDYYLKALRNR